MQTDRLIYTLTENLRPVSSRGLNPRVAVAVGSGAIVAMVVVLAAFGIRRDFGQAILTFPFWMKWMYCIPLCAAAALRTWRLARPGVPSGPVTWMLLPFALLAVVAGIDLARAPLIAWPAMWLGQSWQYCALRVTLLSLPIFVGLCVALKHMAPTRLRMTGAIAGLAAGAFAAVIYALACDEVSAAFVLVWYSLGIAFAAGIGALVGPMLLRW